MRPLNICFQLKAGNRNNKGGSCLPLKGREQWFAAFKGESIDPKIFYRPKGQKGVSYEEQGTQH